MMGTNFTPLSEYDAEDIIAHLRNLDYIVLDEGEFTALVPGLMIVKVQLSQFSTAEERQLLVYDESKQFNYQTGNPEEVNPMIEMMGDKQKDFYFAVVEDTIFKLITPAPWQEW